MSIPRSSRLRPKTTDSLSTRQQQPITSSTSTPRGKFRARRIPGTLALAVTNLISSTILFYEGSMEDASIHRIATAILPEKVWGLLLLVSGIGLLFASATRNLFSLHLFGTLSIFIWTALSISAILSDAQNETIELSGLALGLFVWMLLGPLAMLLAPLMAERSDSKEVK